ncbi:MAG TPA: hypothetical protein VHB79_19540, partial [Polyangiaceae bacterium]|nr:hypothetical protein [Polyangiaceae bacterium]
LGQAKAQQELQAVAGQEQQVALKFEEPAKPAPAAAASPVTPVDAGLPESQQHPEPVAEPKRSMVPVYVAAGIAAAGLGVGIGFAVAAGNNRDDIDALTLKNGRSGCFDASTSDCAAQKDAAQARDRHLTYEVVGFSVAGAALVGTVAYLLWPTSSSTNAANNSFIITGGASPGGANLSILGNF